MINSLLSSPLLSSKALTMRRNMSSRLLFSASADDDEAPADIENPPHQHRPRMISRRTKRFLPFSQPRVLTILLACCLISSLHQILGLGLLHLTVLLVVAIILFLFLAYFLFKTVSRTDLRPIFFYGDEPSAARVSRINGLGVEILPDGSIYGGEFREGIRNGRGVMKMPGTGRMCSYGGDWVEGAYEGHGVEDMAGIGIDGHVYQGQFLEGKRSGYGLMKYCNGDQYKGQWVGDEPHGIGRGKHVHTYADADADADADGYSYEGQFRRGMRHGFGVCHHSNGDIYVGEYYNDTCLGVGTCAFSNGDTYEGSWHQNQMHGYGVLYSTGKSNEQPVAVAVAVAGEWVQGVFKSRMPISDRWIQVTLEAARKAARDWDSEKLGKVEDEVRQAVIDAVNANEGAQVACSRAHSINRLHRFDPRRLLLGLATTKSITASFQAWRRTLGNFGRSIANLH